MAQQAALQVQPVGWELSCINHIVSITCSACGSCDISTPAAQGPTLYKLSALPAAAVARQAAVLTTIRGGQAARPQRQYLLRIPCSCHRLPGAAVCQVWQDRTCVRASMAQKASHLQQ